MACTRTALFLCTGNYYRSRFAEILFNHLAPQRGIAWRAASRGLAVDGTDNVGPISRFAVEGLRARGIAIDGEVRWPIPLRRADLEEADLIVALKESEHRPMLAARFPAWADRIEYWNVDDLDLAQPREALADLELRLTGLLARLARQAPATPPSAEASVPQRD